MVGTFLKELSTKKLSKQWDQLEASSLKIWQLECVYTRDYGPSKPDPWMYNQCMRVTGSNSTNTIIFEDSDVGVQGAKATGAKVVPVKNSIDLIEKLEKLIGRIKEKW